MASMLIDNNAEAVEFADGGLDQLSDLTIVVVYRAAAVGGSTVYSYANKDFDGTNAAWNLWRPGGGVGNNDWSFFHRRNSNAFVQSNTNIIQANRWEWVGILDSDGVAPDIYHGTLTAKPAQPGYGTRVTGSGTVVDDSGKVLWMGNEPQTAAQNANSRIAAFCIANRRMSAAELLTHWPKPRAVPGAGWVIFSLPGYHGEVSAIDLSGGQRNGSLVGSPTLAAGAPWSTRRVA